MCICSTTCIDVVFFEILQCVLHVLRRTNSLPGALQPTSEHDLRRGIVRIRAHAMPDPTDQSHEIHHSSDHDVYVHRNDTSPRGLRTSFCYRVEEQRQERAVSSDGVACERAQVSSDHGEKRRKMTTVNRAPQAPTVTIARNR